LNSLIAGETIPHLQFSGNADFSESALCGLASLRLCVKNDASAQAR
jgi:hypothetical protein